MRGKRPQAKDESLRSADAENSGTRVVLSVTRRSLCLGSSQVGKGVDFALKTDLAVDLDLWAEEVKDTFVEKVAHSVGSSLYLVLFGEA